MPLGSHAPPPQWFPAMPPGIPTAYPPGPVAPGGQPTYAPQPFFVPPAAGPPSGSYPFYAPHAFPAYPPRAPAPAGIGHAPPLSFPSAPPPVAARHAPEAAGVKQEIVGVKRERRETEEKSFVRDLYDVEEATKEIMSPSIELVNELAQELGQVHLDGDGASEPSPRPLSAGSLYRRSLRPGASDARTPAEGDPLAAALSFAPTPLEPRPAAEEEAARAEASLEGAAVALRSALSAAGAYLSRAAAEHAAAVTGAQQLALFRALVDPRLLDATAYRTMRGRARLKRHLSVLRGAGDSGGRMVRPSEAARRGDAGPQARRVVEATAEALLAPLPGPGPDPAPGEPVEPDWRPRSSAEWSAEAAELLIDRMAAFVRAMTSEISRVASDLYPLSWPVAERVLLRLGELSLPFRKAPGALHAKVLCLTAHILNQFDRPKDAVAAYFEAWAELRRCALTPSRLEASVIFNLALLLFGDYQVQTAVAVLEKGYVLAGDRDEELFATSRLEYLQAIFRVWRRDFAGAIASSERSLRFLEDMGPELRVLHARELLYPGMASAFRGNILGFRQYWTRAIEEMVALRDPAAPELDIIAAFLYGLGRVASAKNYAMGISVVCGLVSKVDKKMETPMLAHAQFHLACMFMRVGKSRQAADTFRKAAKGYANPKFAHLFPLDSPRVRRIAEYLNQITTGQVPPGSQAPKAAPTPGDERGGFFQRYFPLFSGGKRSRVGPAAVAAGPFLSTPR